MMDREFIERVREAVDVIEVIGEIVDLKKVGRSWRGLCPFHTEKTPSFYVDPEKGVYHCFGCGASGNIFRFVMEMEKVDFPEAVIKLAKRYNIPIPEKKPKGELGRLYSLMEMAVQFYREVFKSTPGKKARDYLRERGIRDEVSFNFMLGYAPREGKVLIEKARRSGYGIKELKDAGLVYSTDDEVFDLFRDRLLFPICSASGTYVGFGGRALADSVQPKYLNSPDSKIFKKGEMLFGLPQAKAEMREKGEVILVEGYMDHLWMYQEGFRNTVAPLGTALTESQAKLLSRYVKRAYLLYDGDEAGKKATERAIPVLLRSGVIPRIVVLPQGEDPASLLERGERDTLLSLIENSKDLVTYFLDEGKDKEKDPSLYADFIRGILFVISEIRDEVLKDLYIKVLADKTGISEHSLRSEGLKIKKGGSIRRDTKASVISNEFRLLVYAIRDGEIRRKIEEEFSPEDFTDQGAKEIVKLISEGKSLEEILAIDNSLLRENISRVMLEAQETPIGSDEILKKLEELKLRRLIELHKSAIKSAEMEGNLDKLEEHLRALKDIKSRLGEKGGN
jgi:DNA primase